MKVLYEKSFLKDITKIKDKKVLNRISDTIGMVKTMRDLKTLPNVKKINGHPSAFRIRIGDYRLGFFYENETVIFPRFLNRKNIYNYFPLNVTKTPFSSPVNIRQIKAYKSIPKKIKYRMKQKVKNNEQMAINLQNISRTII